MQSAKKSAKSIVSKESSAGSENTWENIYISGIIISEYRSWGEPREEYCWKCDAVCIFQECRALCCRESTEEDESPRYWTIGLSGASLSLLSFFPLVTICTFGVLLRSSIRLLKAPRTTSVSSTTMEKGDVRRGWFVLACHPAECERPKWCLKMLFLQCAQWAHNASAGVMSPPPLSPPPERRNLDPRALPGAHELATHRESEKLPRVHVGTAHALNSNRVLPRWDPAGVPFFDRWNDKERSRPQSRRELILAKFRPIRWSDPFRITFARILPWHCLGQISVVYSSFRIFLMFLFICSVCNRAHYEWYARIYDFATMLLVGLQRLHFLRIYDAYMCCIYMRIICWIYHRR